LSSADATAIFVIVFVPGVILARALVRSSRGERFTAGELTTAAGAIVVGATILALTRSPVILMFSLPVGLITFGAIYLVGLRRQTEGSSPSSLIGYAAIAIGVGALIIAVVRTATGT
jgi:hypothetical protein